MEINFKITLTDEEVELIINTNWTNDVEWDEKYISLINKGILYEDYAFNLFLTYGFTDIGKKVKNKITNEQIPNQIKISEITELSKRIKEINSNDIANIEFLDDDGNVIIINPKILNDWKYTGLNISDFINSEFYLYGFDELNEND